MARDYDKEYRNYQVKKKKYRARVNKANRAAGTYGNGDGLDVAHSKPNGRGMFRLQSASKNRSFARNKRAGRKK